MLFGAQLTSSKLLILLKIHSLAYLLSKYVRLNPFVFDDQIYCLPRSTVDETSSSCLQYYSLYSLHTNNS